MTYHLAIGDRAYSSWSLRAWLLFDRFGIECRITLLDFAQGSVPAQLTNFTPARTVPALRLPEGGVIAESLAIAEELASRHPDLGLWPAEPSARASARALAAEMHSGFAALRAECPMNLRTGYRGFQPSETVGADVRRIEDLWSHARPAHCQKGPWLCGDYSIADAFFAPVAARIAGYALQVGPEAQAYVAAHLADPSFRRWRAMGLARGAVLPRYAKDNHTAAWPGPAPLPARATGTGTPENDLCPYSGKPAAHLLELGDRAFGFCNAFCRDKTVADPEAWSAFMEIFGRE